MSTIDHHREQRAQGTSSPCTILNRPILELSYLKMRFIEILARYIGMIYNMSKDTFLTKKQVFLDIIIQNSNFVPLVMSENDIDSMYKEIHTFFANKTKPGMLMYYYHITKSFDNSGKKIEVYQETLSFLEKISAYLKEIKVEWDKYEIIDLDEKDAIEYKHLDTLYNFIQIIEYFMDLVSDLLENKHGNILFLFLKIEKVLDVLDLACFDLDEDILSVFPFDFFNISKEYHLM